MSIFFLILQKTCVVGTHWKHLRKKKNIYLRMIEIWSYNDDVLDHRTPSGCCTDTGSNLHERMLPILRESNPRPPDWWTILVNSLED